jgi:hypothetical protein
MQSTQPAKHVVSQTCRTQTHIASPSPAQPHCSTLYRTKVRTGVLFGLLKGNPAGIKPVTSRGSTSTLQTNTPLLRHTLSMNSSQSPRADHSMPQVLSTSFTDHHLPHNTSFKDHRLPQVASSWKNIKIFPITTYVPGACMQFCRTNKKLYELQILQQVYTQSKPICSAELYTNVIISSTLLHTFERPSGGSDATVPENPPPPLDLDCFFATPPTARRPFIIRHFRVHKGSKMF